MASFFDADEGVVDVAPLGVAEDRTVATKLAVLIDALADGARRARATRALAEWASLFVDLARLIEHDERVRDPSLDRVLGDFDALAGNATRATVFAEARDLVESLAERAGGSSLFGRGGAVLVNPAAAGMLPFEVTCVVGLDEENMPDPSGRVTELGPTRPTDPDARAGLRAGLLYVLASTRRRVIFLTSDRRAVDGAVLEPALVLAELTDALSAVGHHLVATTRRHPRHGFSTAGVDGDLDVAAAGARAFSFDPVHAMAADVAARGAATPDDDLPLVTVTTASRVEGPVEIDEITQFLRNPQRVFLSDAFGSARVVETSVAERAEAPLLSAGSPLELYPWRESTLRRAVATGEEPSAPDGPDSVVGTVATGYRARAVAELHLDALALFARTLREGFAAAGAVRREEFASPSIVAGFVRDVARGPLEVYDTRRGPALVEFTSSHGYGWRLLGLLVRQAVATAELGRPVSAVLLRGLDNHEAKNPDRRPYLVATWSDPDPVAAARHLVNAVIDLYDKRLERLPLHTNTTSLATDDRLGPGRAKAVKSPALEWLSRGFRGQRDTGESQSPENRLLLPLTYAELRAVRGGGFVEQSAQLTSAVAGVEVTTVVGITPWIDYLPEPAGG
ncbi:MAG: hypothetical protein ACRDV0_04080 [Acidimicrobiales bacterium]